MQKCIETHSNFFPRFINKKMDLVFVIIFQSRSNGIAIMIF